MKAKKRKHDVHVNSLISAMEPAPPQTRLHHNEIKKKWVVNLSGTKLSEAQTHVLQLGLNFAAASTQIPTHHILAAVEKSLTKFTVGQANHVRSKVIGVIKNHRPPKSTLSSEETKALKELRNDQNLAISKADKGNTTVVMDKTDYDKRLLTMLEDNTTYQQLQRDPTPNTEKTVNKFVSQLVADNKTTKIQSYRLKSSNGRAPVLYSLPKLHKENTPLRPIVSFTGSPTYNLSKDLARILRELTGKSDDHVRNSKDFAKFITSITINDDEQMVSFDVAFLFTKIPTGLAVEIAKSRLEALDNLEKITSWSEEDTCKGLQICLNATNLTFRGKHYKQIFGTAMGSPVSSVIANLIMEDVEKKSPVDIPLATKNLERL